MEEGYSVDLITRHSVDFIVRHSDGPFFLYVSHLAIHFPWQGPEDPPHREKGITYEDDKWGIIENRDDVSPHVKSMVESVDASVGEIMAAVEDLGLAENTLIVFASDNGGYIHYSQEFHNISSNGPLRGQKAEVYEGGHRVPCIAWWPGKVPAGSVTDQVTMTMDMYPTFARLAGADIPPSHKTDGMDLRPLLFEKAQLGERTVFWKIGQDRAARKGPWKLCMVEGREPELFHLGEDLGEQNDLSGARTDLLRQMSDLYRAWELEVTSGYDN
jgi:arylsulfatase A-like enzyme